MSGVLCVWAKIPEEVTEWYEDEYIPKMKAQHAIHTLHCELTPSGLEGQASGQLTSPWPLCSVYEVEDIEKVIKSCYDKSNHPLDNRPADARLDSALAESRFDVHSYREIKTWRSQEWGGDIDEIGSVSAVEWKVAADMKDEVLDFYISYLGPKVASSPDTIRFRLFEVEDANVIQGDSQEIKEKDSLHSYFALVEFETEEWPWDVLFELSQNEQYNKYFETQEVVKWQLSHYLVKRTYPAEDQGGITTQTDKGPQNPGEGTSSGSGQ